MHKIVFQIHLTKNKIKPYLTFSKKREGSFVKTKFAKKSIGLLCLFAILLTSFSTIISVSIGAAALSVDLTTLTPTSTTVGWGSLHTNNDLDNNAIDMYLINGTRAVFKKGLVAHANSKIDYNISAYTSSAIYFSVFIGADRNINNNATADTSITFSVKADNTEIYRSGTVNYNTPPEFVLCRIPQGTQKLSLITNDLGANAGDHSAWGVPMLISDKAAAQSAYVETVIVPQQISSVLGTAADIKNSCSFLSYSGESCTPQSISFSSSDTSVVTVTNGGNITPVSKGVAKVTLKATVNNVEYSKDIDVIIEDPNSPKKFFDVASPEGNLKTTIWLDEAGVLNYSLTDNAANEYIKPSVLGINTSVCDFSYGLAFVSESETKTVEDSFDLYSGKTSHVDTQYNEKTLVFEKNGYLFSVIIRLYDDGFGYRYNILGDSEIEVIEEKGTFSIPDNSTLYAQTRENNSYGHNYEKLYGTYKVEDFQPNQFVIDPDGVIAGIIMKPALFNIGNTDNYMLISEADLYSDSYAGSSLLPLGNNQFQVCFAPKKGTVTVDADFTSPWRYAICGTLETVVESNLTESLNPPAAGTDYSWVKTGVSSWSWITEGFSTAAQGRQDVIEKYIEFSAEMGWGYYILDEGWLVNTENNSTRDPYAQIPSWFPEVAEYAELVDVGLIAWIYSPSVRKNTDGTFDLSFLDAFAANGIKGIKIDFFDSESQHYIDMYSQLYKACEKNKMVIICHGSNVPTGERRTYPFVINREAVRGEEYNGNIYDNAMFWPYTRNVVGPMDITPKLHSTRNNTSVYQMAVNIMFESGTPCMGSTPEAYMSFSQLSFYQDLPTSWDELQFISGAVGKSSTLARRTGNTWYIASMSLNKITNGKISLDFLDSGSCYKATIYEEGSTATNVVAHTKAVSGGDVLSYNMNANSAYIVKLEKVSNPSRESTPSVSFSFDGNDAGKLVGTTTGMKFSIDGGKTWVACSNSSTDLTEVLDQLSADTDILVKALGNGTSTWESLHAKIDLTVPDAPTTPGAKACKTANNNDGKLTGLTADMEYRKQGSEAWIAINSDIITVSAGTYEIRYKQGGTRYASGICTVTVDEFENKGWGFAIGFGSVAIVVLLGLVISLKRKKQKRYK